MDGLSKLDADAVHDQSILRAGLVDSGAAIATLLTAGLESGRVKGFKPHPVAFLGYLIAHESSHRGEIGVALTQAGQRLPDKVAYGVWRSFASGVGMARIVAARREGVR